MSPLMYTEQLLIQRTSSRSVQALVRQLSGANHRQGNCSGYTGQTWTIDNWNTDYLLAAYNRPGCGTSISVKVSGFGFDASGQSYIGDRFTGVYFRKVFNSDIGAVGLFGEEIKALAQATLATGIRVLESSKLTLSANCEGLHYPGHCRLWHG